MVEIKKEQAIPRNRLRGDYAAANVDQAISREGMPGDYVSAAIGPDIERSADLAYDYDHLGVTSNDMAQAIALNMQADAGAFVIGKTIGAIAGGMTGLGALGAGLGAVAVGAAQDLWSWYDMTNKRTNPTQFWIEFQNNMAEAKKENSGIDDFLESTQTRMSMIGGAARAGGAATPVGKMPEVTGAHTLGDVFGYLARDMSYMLGTGMWGMIGLSAFSNGMGEFTETLGMNESMQAATKAGVVNALATGITGATFMKLMPFAVKAASGKMLNATIGTDFQIASPLVDSLTKGLEFGAEFAAWQGSEKHLKNMAYGIEEEIKPTELASSFGLGFFLSVGGKGLGALGKFAVEKIKKLKGGMDAPVDTSAIVDGLKPYMVGDPEAFEKPVREALATPSSAFFKTAKEKENEWVKSSLKGTFLDDVMSPQHVSIVADRMRDRILLEGVGGLPSGAHIRAEFERLAPRAYTASNVAKVMNELGVIAPNIKNKKATFELAMSRVYADKASLEPKYLYDIPDGFGYKSGILPKESKEFLKKRGVKPPKDALLGSPDIQNSML